MRATLSDILLYRRDHRHVGLSCEIAEVEMPDRLQAMLDRMDSWRHLPSYQLERRADLLFSLYLPEILRDHVPGARAIRHELIPEFPIKASPDSRLSCKIDYLAVSEDMMQAFFVELKTDMASGRDEQDAYLLRAETDGLVAMLREIPGLMLASKETRTKRKYFRLIEYLAEIGLYEPLPEPFRAMTTGGDGRSNFRGLSALVKAESIRPVDRDYESRIVYITPEERPAGVGRATLITFDQAARTVESTGDEFSKRFARSLREWRNVRAGDAPVSRKSADSCG